MIIAKQIEIRNNIREYFDTAYGGEVIIVPRKQGKNVVILSEKEYLRLNGDQLPAYYSALKPSGKKDTSIHDPEQTENLNKLEKISNLNEGWNGNGAPAIPSKVIRKVRALIKALNIQPEIFPTALETIQLEFDNAGHDHMEIEISESDKAEVFVVPYDDSEYTEVIKSTAAAINKKVAAFMDRK